MSKYLVSFEIHGILEKTKDLMDVMEKRGENVTLINERLLAASRRVLVEVFGVAPEEIDAQA